MILGAFTGNLKVTLFPLLGFVDFAFALRAQLILDILCDGLCKNPLLLRKNNKIVQQPLHSLYQCSQCPQTHLHWIHYFL